MKPLLLALAAAVLLLTFGTVWLGARVREDTVVAHPYEEGLTLAHHRPPAPPLCDLGAGPCSAALDGAELSLELGPRPLAALRELTVEARLTAGGAPADGAELELSFAMPGMEMGEHRVKLSPAAGGRYLGKAVLVRCLSGRRDWRAAVAVRRGGREAQAAFAASLGQ